MRTLVGIGWAVLVAALLLTAGSSAAPGGAGVLTSRPGRSRRAARWTGRTGGHRVVTADDLALTCDLFAMAVGAGLTPLLALERAADAAPPPVVDRLASLHADVARGARLADALDRQAAADPDLRPLLELLATSERSGAPVAALLSRLAGEERARSRRRALAQARKVPVRLLFPLVFLLLPAFLVLTVAPALIAGLR